VPTARRGIDAARAVLRIGGRGHSAAIHSSDSRTIMDFGAAVDVLRVSVNVGNSLGSAGIQTNLPPTMTVGTGFFGGSSVAENLQPKHFVQWTRLAYNSDPAEPFGNFTGLIPWESPAGPVPPYPYASNMAEAERPAAAPGLAYAPPAFGAGGAGGSDRGLADGDMAALREEIRRLVVEELSQIVGGSHG
jgi:acetaldehyde dehydrogenase/alcohol dehydrogenase